MRGLLFRGVQVIVLGRWHIFGCFCMESKLRSRSYRSYVHTLVVISVGRGFRLTLAVLIILAFAVLHLSIANIWAARSVTLAVATTTAVIISLATIFFAWRVVASTTTTWTHTSSAWRALAAGRWSGARFETPGG